MLPLKTDKYQWVFWGMPIYGGMHPVSGHEFSYRRLWDGDMEGRLLREFLGKLKKRLAPGGKAVLWNSNQLEVQQILEETGFYFQVFPDNAGTAVYIVSLPTEDHSREPILDMWRGTLELERSL